MIDLTFRLAAPVANRGADTTLACTRFPLDALIREHQPWCTIRPAYLPETWRRRYAPDKTVAAEYARWLSSSDSPIRPKMTVCSPGSSPVRTAWTPISLRVLSHLPLAAVHEVRDPCRLGRDLGQPQGRPAGRVFLAMMPLDDLDVGRRPSARAASPTSFISRFTARLMFGETSTGIAAAASPAQCVARG